MDIVTALAQFNRKERYWLIRNALGDASKKLDLTFCSKLQDLLGVKISEEAWWAMDYHLDWLAAALHLFGLNDQARGGESNDSSLFKRNIEDVDFVVAFDKTLILIEAKGDTSWNNGQLRSKIRRLVEILERSGIRESDLSVFFVLMSPKRPERLKPDINNAWPDWMLDKEGMLRWMKMHMAEKIMTKLRVNGPLGD